MSGQRKNEVLGVVKNCGHLEIKDSHPSGLILRPRPQLTRNMPKARRKGKENNVRCLTTFVTLKANTKGIKYLNNHIYEDNESQGCSGAGTHWNGVPALFFITRNK
ncbi:hypothetical protein AVEN_49157-1 [Araneus ventricosus]|uniref:Uncharacterized protein n=1 Tax=Araneus ventricosus TaxID=182803 RepID=A0A4Y2C1N4_ARAVE|nr:hypothetical protein AVEN_49157-1 [Araneus ventricosus]